MITSGGGDAVEFLNVVIPVSRDFVTNGGLSKRKSLNTSGTLPPLRS